MLSHLIKLLHFLTLVTLIRFNMSKEDAGKDESGRLVARILTAMHERAVQTSPASETLVKQL